MSAGDDRYTVETLIQELQDEDPVVRIHAGFVLGTMAEEALPAVPVLIEMLQRGDGPDRKLAATTLGQMGPAAEEAIPALLDASNYDEDDGVADLAVWALEEIDLAELDQDAEAA